jgi:hypothetical protein
VAERWSAAFGPSAEVRGGEAGKIEPRDKGTPQGRVLSPLLANLYGVEYDRRLASLGIPFLRYADNVVLGVPGPDQGGVATHLKTALGHLANHRCVFHEYSPVPPVPRAASSCAARMLPLVPPCQYPHLDPRLRPLGPQRGHRTSAEGQD